MRSLLKILALLFFSKVSYAQDTLWADSAKYLDLTQRVTIVYHKNGIVGKKYIKKGASGLKIIEWDDTRKLIRKSKSGKKLISKVPYYKSHQLEYYANGILKNRTFSTLVGCNHIKRRWRKFYSENGKLISKEK
jgi:antitoxin component YwqK of YwqJK toxin-antitoxin module